MNYKQILESGYREVLCRYLEESSEEALYQGQLFSRKSIKQQISPEEIISIHRKVLEDLFRDTRKEILDSLDFLTEFMMNYGLVYREYQSLKDKQYEIKTEIEMAANIQKYFLGTSIPKLDEVDIGVISVPAKKINGDFYRFVEDEKSISVAIADVIGKGVPAALCTTLIKYGMDSLPKSINKPNDVLGNLNRIAKNNLDSSMFITMFYGVYDLDSHTFTYAAAGHEQGFFYHAASKTFKDLTTRGMVLGVEEDITYQKFEKKVNPGDMIVILSDGVTEARTENGFIERSIITELIQSYMHLSAQEMVEGIYRDLEKLQNYELRDDFTLIIFKRI